MLTRIVGAFIGAQAAKHIGAIGGSRGMILGTLAFPVIRRMRLPGLLALGAGGYAVKKLMERKRNVSGPPLSRPPRR